MTTILRHQKYAIIMIYSPNFATSLKETDILFHCVCYIEPVYNTDMGSIPQKANEVQFEFPTKMLGKKVVDNAMILRFFPNFVDSTVCPKVACISFHMVISAISGWILKPFDLQVATMCGFDIMYDKPVLSPKVP